MFYPLLLGTAMRAAGVEAFRYASARDVEGGVNVAVFTPRAFASGRPRDLQTWQPDLKVGPTRSGLHCL